MLEIHYCHLEIFPFDKCTAHIHATVSLENYCPANSGYVDYCELEDPDFIFRFLNFTFPPIDMCFFFVLLPSKSTEFQRLSLLPLKFSGFCGT